MVEAGAEVLPDWRVGAGVIGGKQEREHEYQSCDAGGPDQDTEG